MLLTSVFGIDRLTSVNIRLLILVLRHRHDQICFCLCIWLYLSFTSGILRTWKYCISTTTLLQNLLKCVCFFKFVSDRCCCSYRQTPSLTKVVVGQRSFYFLTVLSQFQSGKQLNVNMISFIVALYLTAHSAVVDPRPRGWRHSSNQTTDIILKEKIL